MRLPDRVTIQRQTITTNALKEKVGAWAVVSTNVPCAVLPVSGNLVHQETGREHTAKRHGYFKFSADVRVADRVIHQSTTYIVVDVASYGGRMRAAVLDRQP